MNEPELQSMCTADAAACRGGDDGESWLYYVGYAIGWIHCLASIPPTAYADAKVGYH